MGSVGRRKKKKEKKKKKKKMNIITHRTLQMSSLPLDNVVGTADFVRFAFRLAQKT